MTLAAYSEKRNVTVRRPFVRLSVCPGILTITYQEQHATRPEYISARQPWPTYWLFSDWSCDRNSLKPRR